MHHVRSYRKWKAFFSVVTRRLACFFVGVLVPRTSATEPPTIEFVSVPASTVQPGGPDYDFRVSRFEIRNDEFVAFLNDAVASPLDSRGAFLYLDVDSGDLYIHPFADGTRGTNGSGTLLFSPIGNVRVTFNGTTYVVASGFEDHPVTGVSWFGAVKFCNWLTLANGFEAAERAYAEGPDASDWRPDTITTANWQTRNLNAGERAALVLKRGFRLPMDGGTDGVHAYGEWFKAASARESVPGVVTFDSIHGYGRDDTPAPADANYFNSADPFEPGTTPVGFFDGVNTLPDFSVTRDTSNAFGMYDLAGNVWEWLQDQHADDPTRRRNRGGSWQSVSASLRNSPGSDRIAGSAVNSTGLRIVQSVREPLLVTPLSEVDLDGPWGGPLNEPFEEGVAFRMLNMTGESKDVAVSTEAGWLTIDPPAVTLGGHSSAVVQATLTADCAAPLAVGEQFARVLFDDGVEPLSIERAIRWNVLEPLSLPPLTTPTFQWTVGRAPTPATRPLQLTSASDSAVSWSATWSDESTPPTPLPWLTLNGLAAATGELAPRATDSVTLAVDPIAASNLAVGEYTAHLLLRDECTTSEIERTVHLSVVAPFQLSPPAEPEFSGPFGGPFLPTTRSLSLSNRTAAPLPWSVTACPSSLSCASEPVSWITVVPNAGTLSTLGSTDLTLSINADASSLPIGETSAFLRFTEPNGGYSLDLEVIVTVEGLSVEPVEELAVSGPRGGPFDPIAASFTLTNPGLAELHWTAQASFAKGTPAWFTVDPIKGTLLDPFAQQTVEVTLLEPAFSFDTGSYHGQVTLAALDQQIVRDVTLTVSGEQFSLDMVNLPAAVGSATDPPYFFRIGRYEVTNAEFARFLNDTLRHRTDPRGHYLYHHLASGSVYLNDSLDGETGDDIPGGALATRLYDAAIGKIGFDAARVEPYFVETGFERHPVVGVSWYGAAKFCNGLTLIQGMPESERAYTEGTTPTNWRPVAFDPQQSSTHKNGYRLPLDGLSAGSAAGNEWFKAASRVGENAESTATYAFGRSTLSAVDANYLSSGDPGDEGTTPVGFFNGVQLLADGRTRTKDTENAFGLYDLCGNAAEWIHDRRVDGTATTRGGHFLTPREFATLLNDGIEVIPPGSTLSSVGFRVAQSLTPVPVRVTQDPTTLRATGVVGGPFSADHFSLTIHNDAAYSIDRLGVVANASWLARDETWPNQLPPNSSAELVASLGEAAAALSVSPAPQGGLTLVPASDAQLNGPTYDFWISTTEVTNDQFAAFLNNALTNLTNARGAFLFHDTDSAGVYLHTAATGVKGTTAPADGHTTLLYDAGIGRIRYAVDHYVAQTGFGRHPVVGVTWYGALKYCNWLTLFAGLPETARAYTEGPLPGDWRPATVSASDWILRGLSDQERDLLVRTRIGYRLPMDDGVTGPAPFNEWHKAASARSTDLAAPLFNTTFGFGRDELTPSDANYLASGDTQTDGTTPAGFFDGASRLLDGTTPTALSTNRYRLHDLTGNVAEWTQELYSVSDPAARAVRGGSWNDPAPSTNLTASSRTSIAATAASPHIGFRVLRGTGHAAAIAVTDPISEVTASRHFLLDLNEPLLLTPTEGTLVSAIFCDDLEGQVTNFRLTNASAAKMPWRAELSPSVDWMSINGTVSEPIIGELDPALIPSTAFRIEVSVAANRLPPGTHTTEFVVTNTRTSTRLSRIIRLEIAGPIDIQPEPSNPRSEFSWVWEGAPDVSTYREFTLSRGSSVPPDCDLDYQVSSTAPWLVVAAIPEGGPLQGSIPALPNTLSFSAQVGAAAADLAVGDHVGFVQFDLVHPDFSSAPTPIRHEIALHILDPLRIVQEQNPWTICCELTTQSLPAQTYTLFNDHATDSVPVTITANVDWLNLSPGNLTIPPRGGTGVTISLNAAALAPHGDYPAEVSFLDELTGETQTRRILVQIREDLSLIPIANFRAAAQGGGRPHPAYSVYTVRNPSELGGESVSYRATADQPWLLLNDATTVQGTVSPQQQAPVVVTFDSSAFPQIPFGESEVAIQASLTLENLTTTESTTRTFSITLVNPHFSPAQSIVSRETRQPGGPEYSFEMGTFPVTNAEFVAFLNDALQNLSGPRGQYLWFDSTTGDVYLNTETTGRIAAVPIGTTHKVFSPSLNSQIAFDGAVYSVNTTPIDYTLHPVTGVDWYGALKYCNWLTLDQGFLSDERCYAEAVSSQADDWRPTTISSADWGSRDLNDTERWNLVADCRGFRLPMDDGYGNATVTADSTDAFNEWFKAAAWNQALAQNTLYGFGRNLMTVADANFRCSGDPFEMPTQCTTGNTTPVGFYDGSIQAGSFSTSANANSFGLFDMTGNVNHWLQDRFAPPTTLNRRTLRGGSWNDPIQADSLKNASRILFTSPDTLSHQIGFRVVQVPPIGDGDFNNDGAVTTADLYPLLDCPAGPEQPSAPQCAAFDFDQDGDVDLADYAELLPLVTPP